MRQINETLTCPDCLTEQICELNINCNDKRTFKGKCIKCKSILRFRVNSSDESGLLEEDSIVFSVNGIQYTVDNQYDFSMTLNDYLRKVLNLTGTKLVCKEGISL